VQRPTRRALVLSICLTLLSSLEVVAILLAFEKPAHAYVDPGSGFLFLQVAGSMIAGALFSLRHRLKKFFGLTPKTDQESPQPARGTGVTETTP
jgi:hypothetical protein